MNNRIKELRYVKASELAPDPRNPRRHPAAQRAALQSMLVDVGIADAVIARETLAGLVLIDGHLRADLDPDQILPVLVTDLDEAEAGKVLATLDPLAAMADVDSDALARLISDAAPPIDLAAMFPDVDLASIVGEPLELFPDRERKFEQVVGNITFVIAEAHRPIIEAALRAAKQGMPDEMEGNANSNGLALYRIVSEWEAQRIS